MMRSSFRVLGIDVGSVSISAAIVDHRRNILSVAYEFHQGDIISTLDRVLSGFDLSPPLALAWTASSPSGIKTGAVFDNRVAMMAAAHHFQGSVGTLLFVGAEKFGAIFFDEHGNYQNYRTNTSCAAGTGSFLDQQAKRLNLCGIAALSQRALANTGRLPKVASRCAVFAKTDIVHAQQEGYTLEEICDGLCYGLARNIVDTLFIREKPRSPIIFTGGVSRNDAVVKHIRSLTGEKVVARDTFLYGAVGAALCRLKDAGAPETVVVHRAADILAPVTQKQRHLHPPLALELSAFPDFNREGRYLFHPQGFDAQAPVEVDVYLPLEAGRSFPVYLGFDVGSTSTKAVFMGFDRQVLAGFYTRTAGQHLPVEPH